MDETTPAWPFDELPVGRMLVLSPHLDDAALSAGALIAAHDDVVVATVFTAGTVAGATIDWDVQCGLGAPADAMACRREEDRRAMAALAARHEWLGHTSSSYTNEPSDGAALAESLRDVVTRTTPSTVA